MSALSALLLSFGAVGCEGPVGPKGAQGASGTAGKEGVDGTAGKDGAAGDAGAPGRNAYLTGSGLNIEVQAVTIDAAGTAKVRFRLSDKDGTPLDRVGRYTEGAVTARFVLAWLDQDASGNATQYTSYTKAVQTSPLTGAQAEQAVADVGGHFTEVDANDGVYEYTFGTKITVGHPDRTHTLGIWATRPFSGVTYVASADHDFLPSGGAVVVKRDVVGLAACNQCHFPLKAHGGERRSLKQCLMCHSGQTVDPDTGNTTEFRVMIHRIHRGAKLPSVVAGKAYQFVGDGQAVSDYSTVLYPQDLQRCDACHTGAQGQVWKTTVSQASCTSCHDTTWFGPVTSVPAGMVKHRAGEKTDAQCSQCHQASGGVSGVVDAHLTPTLDPTSTKLALSIVRVEQTAPGQTPRVTFTVKKDGASLNILSQALTSLTVTLAGPTSEYASYTTYKVQGSGATGTLAAGSATGEFVYTLPAPIASSAKGSLAIGLDAYLQSSPTANRYSAPSVVAYAGVTDSAPVARRTVVDTALCNACHFSLSAHGGQTNTAEHCVLCHGPNTVNTAGATRFESGTVVAGSLNFAGMIHRIHTGAELLQQPFTIGVAPYPTKANPAGTQRDFGTVRYPGDRLACWACHKGKTFSLPLPTSLLPSRTDTLACTEDPTADTDSYCDQRVVQSSKVYQPATAACTGCHDATYIVAHAESNIAPDGTEACATCHGLGADSHLKLSHTSGL